MGIFYPYIAKQLFYSTFLYPTFHLLSYDHRPAISRTKGDLLSLVLSETNANSQPWTSTNGSSAKISHFGLRSVDQVCIKDRPRDLSYSILMKRDPRRAYVTTRSTMAIDDKCLIRSFSSAIFHLDFPLETILLHVTRHISTVFPIACQLISQIRLYDITSTARGLMTADVAKMNMQSLIPQNRLPG